MWLLSKFYRNLIKFDRIIDFSSATQQHCRAMMKQKFSPPPHWKIKVTTKLENNIYPMFRHLLLLLTFRSIQLSCSVLCFPHPTIGGARTGRCWPTNLFLLFRYFYNFIQNFSAAANFSFVLALGHVTRDISKHRRCCSPAVVKFRFLGQTLYPASILRKTFMEKCHKPLSQLLVEHTATLIYHVDASSSTTFFTQTSATFHLTVFALLH